MWCPLDRPERAFIFYNAEVELLIVKQQKYITAGTWNLARSVTIIKLYVYAKRREPLAKNRQGHNHSSLLN